MSQDCATALQPGQHKDSTTKRNAAIVSFTWNFIFLVLGPERAYLGEITYVKPCSLLNLQLHRPSFSLTIDPADFVLLSKKENNTILRVQTVMLFNYFTLKYFHF